MKRKIVRLQRWLNRLSAACDHEQWDSAIVEVDSLCAEAREMREEFCLRINGERSMFSRDSVAMGLRSVAIAIFIVLTSTMPLAVEADKPWTVPVAASKEESKPDRIGWMTQDEENLLRALRAGSVKARQVNAMPDVQTKTAVKGRTVATPVPTAAQTPASKPVGQGVAKAESDIAPEDLMALIQAGEKALRGDEPAIKIIQ